MYAFDDPSFWVQEGWNIQYRGKRLSKCLIGFFFNLSSFHNLFLYTFRFLDGFSGYYHLDLNMLLTNRRNSSFGHVRRIRSRMQFVMLDFGNIAGTLIISENGWFGTHSLSLQCHLWLPFGKLQKSHQSSRLHSHMD